MYVSQVKVERQDFYRELGKIATKDCSIVRKIPTRDILNIFGLAPEGGNVLNIVTALNNKPTKSLSYIFDGFFLDSHIEIEKCGFHSCSGSAVVVIDLTNRLDIVLNVLCGADMQRVRSIPNYEKISRSILRCDLEEDLTLKSLLCGDKRLELYLHSLCIDHSIVNGVPSPVYTLFSDILTAARDILLAAAYKLFNEKNLVLRAYDTSTFILTDKNGYTIDPNVNFSINDVEYHIPIGVYKVGDYFKKEMENEKIKYSIGV